jgi:hypothetical protein
MLKVLHCLPVWALEGSLIGITPESTDERSSHAVETFFLFGNPMNIAIHIHFRKKDSKSGSDSFTKRGITVDTLLITHTGIFPSFFTKTSILTVTCSPENSISLIPVSLITIIWGVNGIPYIVPHPAVSFSVPLL